MYGLTWRLLKLGIVISGIFILMFGWYASSRANAGASILVVVNDSSSNSNKFGRYLGEILRAEGLNSFEIIDISVLTAGTLTDHDLTILAETSLTAGQANLLNNYVNNNGRLIAMQPDTQIKDLFGLGTANGSLVNGYVKINTTAVLSGSIPGQGLTSTTLQIHGNANQYTPTSGAVVLAQLYSNATTSTSYPAVIAGSSGRAVAFTYDLARNVVYTRQGNPANADVDTDGDGVIRTIDLFQTSGGGTPWVDRDKIQIPQADEQQRLFARLVKQMVGESRPMPQLWYFPGPAKTMLILTGDAHGNPTSSYQNELNSLNARGGKISLYLSIAADPPESQAGSNNDVTDWRAQGHTFGVHPYKYSPNPSYPPFDIQNLAEGYDVYGTWFGLQYPNTPKSRTERHHQVAWLGWTDAADIAASRGYGLDTNFYHWGAWLKKADNSWPHGYITGSGQPMKFIRADGQIINLYQQLTQLVDEQFFALGSYYNWNEQLSGTQAVAISKQLIDASQGGDYAALMTQFHVDYYSGEAQVWAEGTLDYANSQGVPIRNADQWLNFTETRHNANYTNIAWDNVNKTLTFDLNANNTTDVSLTTILPLNYQDNSLQSVKVDGLVTNFSIETINQVNVAFVSAPAGNHSFVAQYYPNNTPRLNINDVSVTEGNAGTGNAVFSVSLSAVSGQTVTVNYATGDGSAVVPADYVATSGVLTFAPGVLTQAITVTVQGDTLDEPDETFLVNLSSPVNAVINDSQGVGTIIDNDAGPGLSINDVSVTEGNAGTGNAVFNVSLSAVSGQTVTVNYATGDGSAVVPADYVATGGVLTFAPGVLTQAITVTVQGDTLDEPDETFLVNLSSPVNAVINDSQGVGTIIDNDAGPGLSINDVSVTEGNAGTGNAVFSVSLSAVSGQTVTVNYATGDGSAVVPADYVATSGVLTFAPGVLTQAITVTVQGDTLDEPDETFLVNLSSPVNAVINDSQGVGTIIDNDAGPGLSINDVSVTEGNAGTGNAVFNVSLSAVSGQTVTVNYATGDGSAVVPADYVATGGVLTFAPGVLTQAITVTVQGDTLDEPDETFLVNLSSPTNAIIDDSQGEGTITDDDLAPTVSINDVAVTEGNSGTVNAVFTVALSQVSGKTINVDYATANGSATAPADYLAASGTLTFTIGITTQQIIVAVNGDSIVEPNETFLVNLSNLINLNSSGNETQGTGTINTDNDTAGVSVTPTTLTVAEGGITATYTISLTSQPVATVTVSMITNGQVSVEPTSLEFNLFNWNIAQSVVVTAVNDTVSENPSNFGVISHTVASADPKYNNIAVSDVTVYITDNDAAAYKVFLPIIIK